ncbi:hypothetical protein JCM9279_002441 [Rhodotorula babjevae]
MTESNAYLAYGIMVTTESLLYAVATWPFLEGPFAFLDLVALRKRRGTLAVRQPRPSGQGVQAVPLEVWEMVRHKLVDVELRAAEVRLVDSFMCDCARVAGHTAEDYTWSQVLTGCSDGGYQEFDGLDDPDHQQESEAMLASFGLVLPVEIPIFRRASKKNKAGSHWWSPDTSMMISLPGAPCAKDEGLALHAACYYGDRADEQGIVDVSFSVPDGAKQRFHRLVATMHLELVEVTDGFIANAGTRAAKSGKEARREKRKFKKVPLARLDPRWKLVTMAQTQY